MKSKINIIADNLIPYLKGVLEQYSEIRYLPPSGIDRAQLLNSDAILIRTRTKCDADLLAGSKVRFIGTATIGYDHIDTLFCEANRIKWVNAPGCNSSSVMQYIASALVSISHEKNFHLRGKTLGIIGVGNVGSKVAAIAKLLGMNLLLSDPPRARTEGNDKFTPLEKLVDQSDIITFHVPLIRENNDKTFHMADDRFFELFKGSKILINTSRGPVVETEALKRAMKKGMVSAALLDVWENEPHIDSELLEMASIATPHVAGYSADGKANGTSICIRELNSFFDLGIRRDWYPQDLPAPEAMRELIYDCNNNSRDEIIEAVILATYDVLRDDGNLRASPESFEKLRSNYPVRREFPFYEVKLIDLKNEIAAPLADLGIKVVASN
jgi:erythronate-4-phosphate dehydrogenase